MFKFLFLIISVILFCLLSVYKMYICKLKRSPKISVFVSLITGMLLLYVLCAFVGVILVPGILNKIVLLILGIIPFIIGRLATYEKENIYSYLQIFIILSGVIYIILN